MATMRLGDVERASIKSNFSVVLGRAANNKAFPLEKDDAWEFGMSLLPVQIAEYYEYLREHARDLTSESGWNPEFFLNTDEFKFGLSIYGVSLPQEDLQLQSNHPRYAEILEWCEYRYGITERINDADHYMESIIYSCSSVGQIKRLMPDDILRFIPSNYRDSFKNAERRSRIPAGFKPEPDRLEQLAQMLALGSLSPKEREGIQVFLNRHPL